MKFIESICYKKGQYHNLKYHQNRIERTLANFQIEKPVILEKILPSIQEEKVYKARVVYDEESYETELVEYHRNPIKTLAVIHSDPFDYSYKYQDRSIINNLSKSVVEDDIIISFDGLIKDSSYANLAFWTGKEWVTPVDPLLNGTKRQLLIDQKKIVGASIRIEDLANFEKVSLINAMLDLDEMVIPVSAIQLTS